MVLEIKTKEEFVAHLRANALVAVDFTASWCGPCKFIGPKFEAMAAEFTSINFVKVDVDVNNETAEQYGVSAMPTFKFFKNGEQFDELVGASEAKLKEKLTALAASG